MTSRSITVLAALALCSPALAYIPPSSTVLRDAAKRRDERQAASTEARGTLRLGDAAPIPATLWVKSPGRCRLELSLPGASPAERPVVVVRNGKVASMRAMEHVQAAVAIAEASCALLAAQRGEGSDRAYAHALAARGVSVTSIALGHLGPRVAWVLGGPARGTQPQAWIDKQELHPIRLVADLAGSRRDVRLPDWTEAPNAFPKAIEVHRDGELEARFDIQRTVPNPRVPDSMF